MEHNGITAAWYGVRAMLMLEGDGDIVSVPGVVFYDGGTEFCGFAFRTVFEAAWGATPEQVHALRISSSVPRAEAMRTARERLGPPPRGG